MKSPLVSVIIPAYKQEQFVGETIRSVLNQTHPDIEVIVVNDGSPDDTSVVVRSFDDPRVHLILHEKNRGLPAARNTGMRAASGDLLALLDADDTFHPEKIRRHVCFLEKNSQIGLTYNGRFDLNYSAKTIREIRRVPSTVSLQDFIRGFPFTPSDMVVRRSWAFRVNLFDETLVSGGEDLDFPCRLMLEGCRFAAVDGILNYRRHHSGRYRKNLVERFDESLLVIDRIVNDARCPQEARRERSNGVAHHALVLAFHAFAQDRTELGQTFLRAAIEARPEIISQTPSPIVRSLMMDSITDDSVNHAELLARTFRQFPPEAMHLGQQYSWALGRGFLIKATRAFLWDRISDGVRYSQAASDAGAHVDESYLGELNHQILGYEAEFGIEAAQDAFERLLPLLTQFGGRSAVRRLKGCLAVNRAFQHAREGRLEQVTSQALKAIQYDPGYLLNRGVLALFARSLLNRLNA